MLPGLGHDPFGCGDYQHGRIHTGGSCGHLPYEAFVSGNINDTDGLAVCQIQGGKAEFYGYAPAFFLLKAVAVNAGHCAH
ncbi:hypothetical protein FACS189445_3860 [Spirochaetia bacterium]|nr:hypothetical protein FACS189445_3860 [Spirochaetia bacterium]